MSPFLLVLGIDFFFFFNCNEKWECERGKRKEKHNILIDPMEPFQKNSDCYNLLHQKIMKENKKKDQLMKSFTWDCYSFSQAAKHFNKLGKWDCKTTTSDSKPQGQEPFLKLILTQVLTLIRFQEENVPLSCFSVLGEALVSYIDSEKQFSSQCIALTGTSGPFCHLFLYSPRDALPRHPLTSLFSYAIGCFPQKWHCSCIKASS